MKSHAVEAFEIPKGAKVTIKLPHRVLMQAEGGDVLLLGQDPTAPSIALMDAKDFAAHYEPSASPADLVEPAKRRRGRGGKRPGPRPGSKRGGGTPRATRSPARSADPAPGRVRSVGGSTARALPSEAKREQCRKLYEGGMELTAIAAQEGVKYSTLYYWKTNGEWERN